MRLTAVSHRGALTPGLPIPYPALGNFGLRFRDGQVSLTIAAPGVGKSQLWLNICQRTPILSMYLSADTDAHDVLIRTMALWSGRTADEVESMLHDPAWKTYLEKIIGAGKHVEWVFDSTITARTLVERVAAFAEVHGEYPKLIVIDNLSNTVVNQGDELAEQKAFIRDAQNLARESGAHVAILGHAKGEYDIGTKPIPLSGSLNNLTKVPSIVISLFRGDEVGNVLGLAVTKNRGGRADPAAHHPMTFDVDFSRATIKGFTA